MQPHLRQAERLLTPAQMAQADAAAPLLGLGQAVSGRTLMEYAGAAVARAAVRFGPCRVLVLCGPGGNGGDGWAAARHLAQMGWPVAVAQWAEPRPGTAAAEMRARWTGPVVPFEPAEAARAALVIDAVFGAGLRSTVPDAVADVLAAASRVLAVDVPSGLDGATGACRGRVRTADATVTFVARKPGHLLLPGRERCGPVEVADILMPAAAWPPCDTWRNGPALWQLPQPGATSHKYTRGDVTVLGGAVMTGAARLASAAARRAGAGLVTLCAPPEAAATYRSGEPGLIVLDSPVAALLHDERRKVWVCGPGLSQAAAAVALPLLLAAGRQVVADADALGSAAGRPEALRGCAVITPHEGEFARVFGPAGDDKPAAARKAARLIAALPAAGLLSAALPAAGPLSAAGSSGCVVVLKGADTVVAAPDGRVAINDHAPPWLATAGSGDVLSGIVAALLAQGMPAFEAAAAAVWLHGEAAFKAGPGLIAEDLLTHLPAAVAAAVNFSARPSCAADPVV